MIVSLLQLMGFGWGKPIQSRADAGDGGKPPARNRHVTREADDGRAAKSGGGPVRNPEHAQAAPSRRPEVKTKPISKAKTKVSDTAPKAKAPPKKESKAKPAQKAARPVVKSAAKPASKAAPAKKAAATKAPAKPAAKSVAKPVAKAAPAKKVAVASKKVAVKGKVSPAKPSSATVASKAATAKKKTATPVAPKAVVKPTKAATAAPAVPVKPPKKEIQPLSNPIISAEKAAAKPEAEKSPVPAKSPRVSSRLAQLTVPSMASTPAVASTAAKASYGEAASTPLPVPPHYVPIKKDPKLANNWKTKAVELLTDEEVVAMPDAEYMNDTQLAFFRMKLLQLKNDILASAGETTEHLREETVVVPDPADRATIEEEHALELRTRDRERKLLKKIEQSIARIDAGDYGYCDETGEAIGVGRLLARPTATLSLEAQQRRELKQKMFGD